MKRCMMAAVESGLIVAAPARSQSLNIDFGQPGDAPSRYGAAGLPGVWNSVQAYHGTTAFDLLDLQGNPTPAWLNQIGGSDLLSLDDPATTDGAD